MEEPILPPAKSVSARNEPHGRTAALVAILAVRPPVLALRPTVDEVRSSVSSRTVLIVPSQSQNRSSQFNAEIGGLVCRSGKELNRDTIPLLVASL